MLEAQIENALEQHEPRITLQYVNITVNEAMNRYDVTIAYVPVSGGNMVEIEFFLNRLR
jgi:phage baseplate assembly protein W